MDAGRDIRSAGRRDVGWLEAHEGAAGLQSDLGVAAGEGERPGTELNLTATLKRDRRVTGCMR